MRATIQAARDGYKPDEIEDLAQSAVTKELISLEKHLPLLDSMVTMCPLHRIARHDHRHDPFLQHRRRHRHE